MTRAKEANPADKGVSVQVRGLTEGEAYLLANALMTFLRSQSPPEWRWGRGWSVEITDKEWPA